MMSQKPPRPGSPAAKRLGCNCPVMDNAEMSEAIAQGAPELWIVREGCPVHDHPGIVKIIAPSPD